MNKLLLILLIFFTTNTFAKNINPDYKRIFVQNEVTLIRITMQEKDKHDLIYPDDPWENIYYKTSIQISNSLIDTTIQEVGIRIRGNTSRNNIKKSFKIDFKEFGGGQVEKLKKLNLKPNNNDPSMIREPLSWLMYRKMHVPAARTSYVNLYINNEFMGIYQNVENIDDEFVDRRYGNEEGNLYKCFWGATLKSDNNIYDNSHFELKTNEEVNDRSHLQELVNHLNSTINSEWPDKLEKIFDVYNYLKQLAVESMIGHWDGYSYNSNNFYLYYNPQVQKIHFIPYDLDNTWGIDWIGPDWGKEDLRSWYSDRLDVVLTKKILSVKKYKNIYYENIREIMEIWFDFKVYAVKFQETIEDEVHLDHFYTLDRGYDYDDFKDALKHAAGEHVEYSIYNYIETRYNKAIEQIGGFTNTDNAYTKNHLFVYPNPTSGKTININRADKNIEIFNSKGQKVDYRLNNNQILFPIPLNNGIYWVKSNERILRFTVVN